MSDLDDFDDFDDEYRRRSALDPSRPSDGVRQSILDFANAAAKSYAEEPRAATSTENQTDALGQARRQPVRQLPRNRRRRLVFGTMAAALLAGLVVVPLVRMTSHGPELREMRAAGSTPPPQLDSVAPSVSPPAAADANSQSAGATNANDSMAAPEPVSPPVVAPAAEAPAFNRSQAKARDELAELDYATPVRNALSLDAGTALRQAASRGDISRLQTLLKASTNLESRDASGRTALMLAVVNEQADAVELLLAHGADPNAKDLQGAPPSSIASAKHDTRILDALQRARTSTPGP